ncbi:MAG: fatty acid desaturase, partial [Bacteroidota bacterium]
FLLFAFKYLTWGLFAAFMVYTMIVMSTHGTIWLHRYGSHYAYRFSHPIWRFITQNLVIKTVPEEIYIVSHHVHHARSDEPGDPYNAVAGFWYCMLAEFNHQRIAEDFDETDYKRVARYMEHTGVKINTYEQYQKYGSITHPLYVVGITLFNWALWGTIFFLIGGPGLVCAMFGAAMFWFMLVRAFNYTGHGGGHVKHQEGVDYDRRNLSINQTRPGLFSGEWHNNHHLYPNSARAGFLPYQIDLAWIYIYLLHKIGGVSSYNDSKDKFMQKYREANQVAKLAKPIKILETVEGKEEKEKVPA